MTDSEVKTWNDAIDEVQKYLYDKLEARQRVLGDNPRYDNSNHWLIKSLSELRRKTEDQKMVDKLEAIRKILES